MKRRLFTILSALLLLLFVAMIVLWVRSYGGGIDSCSWTLTRRTAEGGVWYRSAQLLSDHGQFQLSVTWGRADRPGSSFADDMLHQADASGGKPRTLFHRIDRSLAAGRIRITDLNQTSGWGPVQWWHVQNLKLGPGLATAWRIIEGHCKACGYDLRATPGRCPECGCVTALRPLRPTEGAAPRLDAK